MAAPPQWEMNPNSIPDDVALNIASFLQVSELCALGSCSRFWRQLCSADCLWISLSRTRWPSLDRRSQQSSAESSSSSSVRANGEASSSSSALAASPLSSLPSPTQGWKSLYIQCHEKMSDRASAVIKFVEQCSHHGSLEVGDHLKAVEDLHLMELGFMDVKHFFFTAKQNILVNLVGLHYSIFWLKIPVNAVIKALKNCQISERQICVNWLKLGRWFYGFRLPDESRSRRVSLCGLATPKEEEVRNVLNRGAVHEVLRVQITPVATSTT